LILREISMGIMAIIYPVILVISLVAFHLLMDVLIAILVFMVQIIHQV